MFFNMASSSSCLLLLLVTFVAMVTSQDTAESSIIRPCVSFELDCVREYLQSKSQCSTPVATPEATLNGGRVVNYLPYFNITTLESLNFTGAASGYITEFYVNQETGKTVLSVGFGKVEIGADLTALYYLERQEPAALALNIVQYFDSMEVTTIFQGVENLNLKKSVNRGFFPAITNFTINASDETKSSPYYDLLLESSTSNLDILVLEFELRRSPRFAALWIQNYLCDFKTPLEEVSFRPLLK